MLHALLVATFFIFQPQPIRILFVGNSLTFVNDLPATVCGLARATGKRVVCASIAKPDYSLEDHWNEPEARTAIARGWDFVVLQQGPSALPESRRLLITYAKRFDAEIRQAGARTALYMVWPSRTRRADFNAVSQSYAAAASEVKGLLMPAGDAWRAAWAIAPNLPLYGPDGFHPSATGSYLAALVIYGQLFGESAPAAPVPPEASAMANVLQRAAQDSIAQLKPR